MMEIIVRRNEYFVIVIFFKVTYIFYENIL